MINLNFASIGHLLQSIKKRSSGQLEGIIGIMFIIYLSIFTFAMFQISIYMESALLMEDALAASNLASALIDIEEYGISHKIIIKDTAKAFDLYEKALIDNLELDNNKNSKNKLLISDSVKIEKYIIYNVHDNAIDIYESDGDGSFNKYTRTYGSVLSPDGKSIESTGIYSEISFDVKGFFDTTVRANKGKLVDIVSNI